MGLLSLFQRNARPKTGAAAPRVAVDPTAAAEAVREARTRARRRLMGATVLLLVGIIGFPLLFETRPRPIPVDLPIEIPARNGAPALVDGGPHVNRLATPADGSPPSGSGTHAATPSPSGDIVTEPAASAPAVAPAATTGATRPVQFSASVPAAASRTAATSPASTARPAASRTANATPAAPAAPSKPAPATAATAAPATATTPASASSDAAADAGHFVVQIGAFAEQPKAHEARMKVEKLGLKTYVQVVDTAQGKRIRVRVGPYATKAEADKAAARIKGDGLPAAVLQL